MQAKLWAVLCVQARPCMHMTCACVLRRVSVLSTTSVFPVPGNFTRPSRNCTCNKKYSACGSQVCFSFGPTTYSVYLLNCLSQGSSSMTKSKMAPNMCSTRTVACLWIFIGIYACVCVRCWQPGFATWQDEDWIGRVPWHACMHVWNPYACSCGWCKRLCLWMFYIPLHIFASILGLQGKPALSCIWHSNQNNNTLS